MYSKRKLTLWVHIDETHVCGSQWLLKVSRCVGILGVVLVLVTVHDTLALDTLCAVGIADVAAEPLGLAAPVDRLVRLEGV